MNITAREQAQAFDQLGSHVIGLSERLERVEHNVGSDGLRDAVKALHQGLSRVADQITETANQSNGAPAITGFAPTIGNVGTAVTITGANFDTIANDKVKFNVGLAIVSSATGTSITTTATCRHRPWAHHRWNTNGNRRQH